MTLGPIGRTLRDKLTQRFNPAELEVIDESARHAGHAGAHADGESHFKVKIVAAEFTGKPMVQCHRLINETLADELQTRVHALSISAKGI